MQLDETSILPIGTIIIIIIIWFLRWKHWFIKPESEDMIHSCEKCGREFNSEEKAAEHEKECTGEYYRSFECEKCGKRFFTEDEALEHEKNCSGILEGKYICQYCGSRFSSKDQVNEHEEHCGNRPG